MSQKTWADEYVQEDGLRGENTEIRMRRRRQRGWKYRIIRRKEVKGNELKWKNEWEITGKIREILYKLK